MEKVVMFNGNYYAVCGEVAGGSANYLEVVKLRKDKVSLDLRLKDTILIDEKDCVEV